MAIEIIPKKTEEAPSWQNILLYLSIIFLIFFIVSYFILNYFVQKEESKLSDLENQLSKAKIPQVELEKEILLYQKKIEDFGTLLSQHKKSSNFFKFLETLCHPQVFFEKTELNVKGNQAVLNGQTDDFVALEQQILIFKQEERIETTELLSIGKNDEGKIEFGLEISFDPEIFKSISFIETEEPVITP